MAEEVKKNNPWHQYLAAGSVCLGMLSTGTVMGWTSPSMKLLLSEESPVPMTYSDLSWIECTYSIGSALSAIYTAYAMDRIGRKPVIIISSICYIASWLCGTAACNIFLLHVTRFIAGFAVTTSLCCNAIYISETVEHSRRGTLVVLKRLSLALGTVFESFVGPRVSFRMLNGVSMIFPVLFLLTFAFMPESPHFLVSKGLNDRAYSVLMWLRGQEHIKHIEKEMADIRTFSGSEKNMNFLETVRAIVSTRNRKALILMSIVLFGVQFSGANAITSFTARVFILIDSPINPDDAVVFLNGVCLAFILLTMIIIDKVGRKILLLVSLLGCSLSHVVIGTYLLLLKNGTIGTESAWLAMSALFSFKMFLSLGMTTVPYILLSELFPSETKAWSNSLASLYLSLLGIIVTKLFQVFDELTYSYYTFFIFAVSLLITCIFVILLMPETKNKSFTEIQELLQGKTKSDMENRK